MAYVPHAPWVDFRDSVDAADMDHIEQGIKEAADTADSAAAAAAAAQSTADSAKTPTNLPSGVNAADLNTITANGVYYQGSSTGTTTGLNYPQDNFAGLIEVFNKNDIMIEQRATYFLGDSAASGSWVRTWYTSTGWSKWVRMTADFERYLSAAADFNTYTQQGTYLISSTAAGGANSPSSIYGHLEVLAGINPSSQVYTLQRYTEANPAVPSNIYERVMGATGWSTWKKLAYQGVPGGSDLTGTGSPIGVVTPSGPGVYYTDTASTCGARRWMSTSTSNTSWIVIVGSVGRNIANLIDTASWTVDFAALRRVNNRVTLAFRVSAASELPVGSTLYAMPAGFGPTNYTAFGVASYPRSQIYTIAGYSVLGRLDVYPSDTATIPAGAKIWGEISFTSISAWPTTLPGIPA